MLKTAGSHAQAKRQEITTAVLLRINTALRALFGGIKMLRKRIKANAFYSILGTSTNDDSLLPVSSKHSLQQRPPKGSLAISSPYRREAHTKHKSAATHHLSSMPPKLNEKKQQEILNENSELARKVHKKQQRVRSFLHEMDQMLAEHEEFLKQ